MNENRHEHHTHRPPAELPDEILDEIVALSVDGWETIMIDGEPTAMPRRGGETS